MDRISFDSLRDMASNIEANAALVPSAQAYIEYWHGAAFDVLGTRCVMSLQQVRKIVELTPIIPIPGVKHWVRGLANISGRVLSIVDLVAFLSKGTTVSAGKQALVISGRGINVGLVIDASYGGVKFPIEKLRKDLPVAEQLRPYVSGIFSSEQGDYAVFDIDGLLSDADFSRAGVVMNN